MSSTLHTNINGESALLGWWSNSYFTLVKPALHKVTKKGFCFFILWHLDRDSLWRKHRRLGKTMFYYYWEESLYFKKVIFFISTSLFLFLPFFYLWPSSPASLLTLVWIRLKQYLNLHLHPFGDKVSNTQLPPV